MKKLYQILEINENATDEEIKKAYKKLAKRYHPDICKSSECEEKFKEINKAYEILKDPKKRQQYDIYGDHLFEQNGHSYEDFKNSGFDSSFEDLLNQIFGNSFKNSYNDFGSVFEFDNLKQFKVEIPLKTAINGGIININGKKIKIPPRIKNGAILKFEIDNTKYEVFVKIKPDKEFNILGNDIYKKEIIKLSEAIFGTTKEIDLFGEKIKIKIPSGIQCGKKLRIKNKGLGSAGNLYIEIDIIIPDETKFKKEDSKILKELLQKYNY